MTISKPFAVFLFLFFGLLLWAVLQGVTNILMRNIVNPNRVSLTISRWQCIENCN